MCQPEPKGNIAPAPAPTSVGEILNRHVQLEIESLDGPSKGHFRMYLNLYVGDVQTPYGAACFFIPLRGRAQTSGEASGLECADGPSKGHFGAYDTGVCRGAKYLR